MQFTKLPSQLILERTSWRKYNGQIIDEQKATLLNKFISTKTEAFFGNKIRFELVAATPTDPDELRGLGTYGFIHGASGFIVGAMDKNVCNLEDYGYLLEEIILYATDFGLGTCWLGGSFYKSNFSARINTKDNEIVPAVVSVGYTTEKRGLIDNIIRSVADSKSRKDWNSLFFEDHFAKPLTEKTAGKYSPVFDMVRMSPSASNKQPWRIVKEYNSNNFHFFLSRTKGYAKPKLFSDLQRVDMGIAMCHFEQGCKEKGLNGNWELSNPCYINLPEYLEYTVSWKSD